MAAACLPAGGLLPAGDNAPTGHPFLLALMSPAVGQDATGGPARHGIEQANKLSYYSALTPQPGRLLIILGVRATRTGLDANL
jgi:hypothetical protein